MDMALMHAFINIFAVNDSGVRFYFGSTVKASGEDTNKSVEKKLLIVYIKINNYRKKWVNMT